MKAALILLIFLSGTCFVYAQKPQKYDGCMFGPRVDTTCGEVTVNLYGENKGMISIETKAGTRTKSNGEISVQKTSGKMSYPAGLVNIKIGTTYYYFKGVEESYDKKERGLLYRNITCKAKWVFIY